MMDYSENYFEQDRYKGFRDIVKKLPSLYFISIRSCEPYYPEERSCTIIKGVQLGKQYFFKEEQMVVAAKSLIMKKNSRGVCNIRMSVYVALDADVEKIMSELSWNTKPQFLEYIYVKHNLTNSSSWPQMEGIRKPRSLFKKPVSKIYWMPFMRETGSGDAAGNKINHTDQPHLIRRVRSIDSTLLSAHEWNRSLFNTTKDEDDGLMKMKLFRLMYESVKDSDLKVKRAELVKMDYENSTEFDLGYVSGDASDKLNVMMDISKTLKRMYHAWKPVEHVNAYEQIANMAIEVSHLVDMVRMIDPHDAH